MVANFDWDPEKNLANQRKHGITFEDAVGVLADPYAIFEFDEEHSVAEDRYTVIGMCKRLRILFVVTTDRGETPRLITARPATAHEKRRYQNQPR